MKGFFAVYVREVRLRKAAFAAGLAAGLLAILLGGILRRYGFLEVANLAAATFAVLLGGFGALAVGATVLPSDLVSGRMRFDFARPVSGPAIWAGRFLGGFSVVLSLAALPLVPVTLLGDGFLREFSVTNPFYLHGIGDYLLTPAGLYGSAALALLALYAASICVSAILRIPSRWLVLDVLTAGGLFVAGFLSLSSRTTLFFPAARFVYLFVLGIVLLGALVGTFLLVVWGRTDGQRARAVLSMSLTTSFLSALLLLGTGWAYVETRGPEHLQNAYLGESSSDGRWWVLSGSHFSKVWFGCPLFLLDAETGRWERVSWNGELLFGQAFSPTGKSLAWLDSTWDGEEMSWILTVQSLPSGRRWRCEWPGESRSGSVAFSPSGKRILLLLGGQGHVLDSDSGATLASFRIGEDKNLWLSGRFASDESVLVYAFLRDWENRLPGIPASRFLDTSRMELWRFSVSSRSLTQTG
ncbi:MAG: WD40 repeat domain-containing protein, partial [Acidobacteriota bacterium]